MTSRLGRIWIGLLGSSMVLLGASNALAQTAGREPQPGSPLEGGVTYIDIDHPVTASGELRLWQVVSSEGARVMLKVFRPEGDRLLLVGSSALESVPAGGVSTFELLVPVARNDLIGCFCPDSSCADGFADGLVLSAAGDVGTSPSGAFATGTGSPSIFAAGSSLVDVPSTASIDLVVPVVGRTPGIGGTVWRTQLELFNPAAAETTVALYLNLSDSDNTAPAASAQVAIAPRATLIIEDLIAGAFGLDEAVGSVDIVATPLVVEVRAMLGEQTVGTPLTLNLAPFSHTQVNRVLNEMGVAQGLDGVRLEVAAAAGSGGRFFAYISRVDNGSGDAVFLLGEREPALP
jgi:hypothetical protein